MKELEQHPLALCLMPGGMDNEEFDAFCEDVAARGIIVPITLYEGKVLDGWHRYRAHKRTGAPIQCVEYTGEDPSGHIAACNLHRRRLSSLQKALFAARVHLNNGVPQTETCRRYSISKTALALVLKAIQSRNSMLLKRIETDSDFTRGMLREELEDLGLVHAHYGSNRHTRDRAEPEEADEPEVAFAEPTAPPTAKSVVNSVFAFADQQAEEATPRAPRQRRSKAATAATLQGQYLALMYDEKRAFLAAIWPDARPICEEAGLPGLGKARTTRPKLTAVS